MKKDIKPLQRSLRDLLSPQVCQIWTTTTWDPQIWQILEPLWWIPTSIYQHLPASTSIHWFWLRPMGYLPSRSCRHQSLLPPWPQRPQQVPPRWEDGPRNMGKMEKFHSETYRKVMERYMSDTWGTMIFFFPGFPCWWRVLGQKSNEIHTAPMETSKKSGWWCWSTVDAAVGILNSWPNCQCQRSGSFFAVTCWIHFLRAIKGSRNHEGHEEIFL